MGDEKYNDFRDLEVWRQCRDIRKNAWHLAKNLPPHEKYRLADQVVRSSRSSTACIAEGYGRYHYQENIQFCRQARGSLFELIDHILVAEECEYVSATEAEEFIDQIKTAVRSLNGYIKYLKGRKESDQGLK